MKVREYGGYGDKGKKQARTDLLARKDKVPSSLLL